MIARFFLSLGFGVFLATSASAQLATQTALVGTVTDTAGLVVPGAQVVAVNIGTRDTYETTTNLEGYYNIEFVRPGRYAITVTLAGFRTVSATGIQVATNQVVRTNAVLQIGEVAETLTVVANATVLDTERATIAERLDARQVTELPSRGRNVWQMTETTPGVQRGTREGTWIGAGQRDIQNSLSLDGINAAANLMPSTSMQPIADAVAEISVQTGTTSAEYGSYLGVHVNVVTKSGTNNAHGSGSYFYQGDALDARGFFEDRSAPANPRRYDQFAFQADGPLVIPRFYDGRNRTFFMAAYEGIREDTQAPEIVSVPTSLMRQGNFSEVATIIRNPFTGQPYPGNVIPPSQLSPVAQRALQYYPAANRPGTGANLLGSGIDTEVQDQVLVRIDQNLGNRARVYFRYNWQDEYIDETGAIPITGIKRPRTNYNYLWAYTHTLRSNLLNDFRIGYHRVPEDTLNHFQVNDIRTAGADLGIPGFNVDVTTGNLGIPHFNITGFNGLNLGGTNWYQMDDTFQVSNVVAYNRGSHSIRTGFDLRRLTTARRSSNDVRGLFSFNGQMSGYAMADFMLGVPREVYTPVDMLNGHVGGWRNGFFINDTWQATRDLTLNLGLRYELNTPVKTFTGYSSMLNRERTALIPATLPSPGFELHEPNYKDIAPRVGVTYRLNDKTVLRSGFGIYYNPNQMNSFTLMTNNPPLAARYTFFSDPGNPTLTLERPTGVAGVVGPPNVISVARDLPNARKNQWSVDVQRELWGATALDLQYVGSRTTNLDRSFWSNTPAPGPGPIDPRRPNQDFRTIRMLQNDLVNNYDAFSVVLRRRMSDGLQASAHYTYSRNYDMATNSNAGGQTMDQFDIWRDYAPANWSVPHRFVASYIWALPFLRDTDQPVVRHLLAGWQVGGVTTVQSGTPINVTIQPDRANVGTVNQRPDLVGTPSANCGRGHLINCIDASAFALPAPFTFGSAPRNLLRGPGRFITDVSLAKNFALGAHARAQFRAEAFNVFNTPNFSNPGPVFGTATFGRITSAQPMRQIQLGMRLLF